MVGFRVSAKMEIDTCVDQMMVARKGLYKTIQLAYPYFRGISIQSYAGGLAVENDVETDVGPLSGNDIGYTHLRIDCWSYGSSVTFFVWFEPGEDGLLDYTLSTGLYCTLSEVTEQDVKWAVDNWVSFNLTRMRCEHRCKKIKNELMASGKIDVVVCS